MTHPKMSDKNPTWDEPHDEQFIHCNVCRGDTRHTRLLYQRRDVLYRDNEGGVEHADLNLYVVWQCKGCLSFALEIRSTDTCRMDDGWENQFYPKPNRNELTPKLFQKLPAKLENIYRETLKAFNHEARVLAATGLRALIEAVCKDHHIDDGNLEKRIDALTKVLPANIVNNLHALRFMGNEATHDLSPPPEYELTVAIEICEDLLNFLYELDYKTARLGRSRQLKSKNTTRTAPPSNEATS